MPRVTGMMRGRRQPSPPPGLLVSIGPEVLSGASDNDPTNVGTAVAVGAQSAYQLSWVALLVAPLLGVVLTIAAQVGAVARADLQTLTVKRYGQRVAAILLVSVVLVNVVTIAADLQAGAAGIGLLAGVDPRWLVLPLGLALLGLLVVGKYDEVVAVLRYVLLGFLAFGLAAILARPEWSHVLRGSLVPTLSLRHARSPAPSPCSAPPSPATSTCGRPSAGAQKSRMTTAQASKSFRGRGSAPWSEPCSRP